jgi:hypothetical protein
MLTVLIWQRINLWHDTYFPFPYVFCSVFLFSSTRCCIVRNSAPGEGKEVTDLFLACINYSDRDYLCR